jgi:hypothetical protein
VREVFLVASGYTGLIHTSLGNQYTETSRMVHGAASLARAQPERVFKQILQVSECVELLMALTMQISLYWDVTCCSQVEIYLPFAEQRN